MKHQHNKSLRALHLPINWASVLYHQVNALETQGVKSKVLLEYIRRTDVGRGYYILSDSFPFLYGRRGTHKLLHSYFMYLSIINAHRCDVIHWYAGQPILGTGIDTKIFSRISKKKIVQWQGSEFRDPTIEADINPWYVRVLDDMRLTTSEIKKIGQRSRDRQKAFLDAGFTFLVPVDLLPHVLDEARKYIRHIKLAVDSSDLLPKQKTSKDKIVIGHAPSSKGIKGTKYIQSAVEKLSRQYPVELRMAHGVSRRQAIELIRDSDLFIDNLLQGMYCMASLEALSVGVPTICYVAEHIRSQLPNNFPVIGATPENITDVIIDLIKRRDEWMEIGADSIKYINEYHSYVAVGKLLHDTYQSCNAV